MYTYFQQGCIVKQEKLREVHMFELSSLMKEKCSFCIDKIQTHLNVSHTILLARNMGFEAIKVRSQKVNSIVNYSQKMCLYQVSKLIC